MKHLILLSIFLSLLLFSTACTNKRQLGGKVSYADDHSPVDTGFVVFTTEMFQSRGAIQPDGSYVMSTTGNRDGIPPGEYKVFLAGTDRVIPRKAGESPQYVPLVDMKFLSPETSGLTFTVDGKIKRFDIRVDRAKKK